MAGHGAERRLSAPAAERNAAPIREALAPLFSGRCGLALEIGSGTGQHAAEWAGAFPALDWQPSDPEPGHLDSIAAWVEASGLPNLRAPLRLDARDPWPIEPPLAAVMAINVIHISPWTVAEAIVAGAARHLGPEGVLVFYGPFREGGRHTTESNAAFDASLRARDPAWGVRDLDDVTALAAETGLSGPQITRMPANNLTVVYRRG